MRNLIAAATFTFVASSVSSAAAKQPGPIDLRTKSTTLAVIGDSPYGAAQTVDFPNLVTAINTDPDVTTVVHLGDIKNGSTRCDDSYFATIGGYFATFADPVVYTPGDNEWTDCHRSTNGKYDPIERLGAVRSVFYPTPGLSLGADPRPLLSQAWAPRFSTYVENQMWVESRVVFATTHVVGSNDNLAPWFGDDTTDAFEDDPARRIAEHEGRKEAALAWIDAAFGLARLTSARGVALLMQADMWDAFSIQNGLPLNGFDAVVQRLARRARDFGRPVLVLQGDSHVYLVDKPLENGDPIHGVTESVPNVTRVVVQGANTTEWLKLRVDPRTRDVFSWERIVR